ncbi:transcriptional regulator (plasmid) [Rhizobium sp. RCAM05350]|nr:transcriptional regulator [Rhizobium sp. RCAM05350]
MKKVQPNFVVEYKSGRRKTDPKANSIWGNMDLKSVARDLQEEAVPFLTRGKQDGASDSKVSLPIVKGTEPLLTPSIGHPTTATATQETIMADENDTTTINDAPASVVADAPKKQRKPRAKKAAPETASVEVAAEPAAALDTPAGKRGKQTRGRKPKSNEVAVTAKKVPVKRGPKAVQAALPVPAVAIDEMADLLQLEEENQRLRKLLAEKLRAENADLRKRLNLG